MEVRFLGVSSCIPDVGGDTATLVLNGRHLIDTGWNTALRLREMGLNPLHIETVWFTHLHHDHYLGLPQFIFYRALLRNEPQTSLRFFGPERHLASVIEKSWQMLQIDRFPELRVPIEVTGLQAGERFDLGELRVEVRAATHVSGVNVPEPAVNYRFTDTSTGASCVYSGDTSYDPGLGEWARGAQVLIHDTSHTAAAQAGQLARTASVKQLYLMHYPAPEASRLLAEARAIFPATEMAQAGVRIQL